MAITVLASHEKLPDDYVIHAEAHTKMGVDALVQQIDKQLQQQLTVLKTFYLPVSEGRALAWLHQHGQVVSKQLEEDSLHITVRLTPTKLAQFEHNYASIHAAH